jgi:hypothetical protein
VNTTEWRHNNGRLAPDEAMGVEKSDSPQPCWLVENPSAVNPDTGCLKTPTGGFLDAQEGNSPRRTAVSPTGKTPPIVDVGPTIRKAYQALTSEQDQHLNRRGVQYQGRRLIARPAA